jgi:hypothetical protein
MTDEGAPALPDASTEIELRLTPDELDLTRTALRVLLSTLGREEADELEAVQAVLAKIAAQAEPAR